MKKAAKNVKISTKKKKIDTEVRRLRNAYQKLPSGKKILAYQLIKNAGYLAVTLSELTELMYDVDMLSEKYEHGENQSGTKPATYVAVYDSLLKTYSKIIDQLDKMLPRDPQKPPEKTSSDSDDVGGDLLEEFIKAGRDS